MNDSTLKTIDQVEAFLSAVSQVDFSFADVPARYAWMTATLAHFCYHRLFRPDKGVLRRYLEVVTGYSRARWTAAYSCLSPRRQGAASKPLPASLCSNIHRSRHSFAGQDGRVATHVCGPATKKIVERAHHIFGDVVFVRLAQISVSHLYNLRRSVGYQRHHRHFEKTKPRMRPIGERRKPATNGQPG